MNKIQRTLPLGICRLDKLETEKKEIAKSSHKCKNIFKLKQKLIKKIDIQTKTDKTHTHIITPIIGGREESRQDGI